MSEKKTVGFIGLGDIGGPMARHLLAADCEVVVFDLVPAAVEKLVDAGARGAASLAEMAGACSYIGVCVRDDAQVESVLYGGDGLFANMKAGALIGIHSTVTQASLLRWVEEAAERGLRLLDVPMTGGASRAEEGTLCYMVGADDEALAEVEPLLQTSADKVVHAGPVGAGIALKLCNNYMQYTEFVAMAEAARLADACGLELDVLREVGLSNGVVNEQMHSFVSGRNALAPHCTAEQMAEFFGAFGALGRKDLECALETASQKGVVMPTAEFIRDRIEDVFLARDESRPPAPAGDAQ